MEPFLQLPDKTAATHGGKVNWNETDNSLAYTGGHSGPIEKILHRWGPEDCYRKARQSIDCQCKQLHYQRYTERNIAILSYRKNRNTILDERDLQTAYYNDSKNIPIQKILGTGDRCFQYSVPGFLLYNGEAVLTGKLAPLDWRIPSDNDWNRLKEYIAGNASVLKKAGTWSSDTNPATNETGFGIAPQRIAVGKR